MKDLDDNGMLSVLSEAVVDGRGFVFHGDEMPPDRFVATISSQKYDNTASMYGTGMYCVRHEQDAIDNAYGPWIYKLYVRDMDQFLHLDQLPYNSAHGVKGEQNDRMDSESFVDDLGRLGAPSFYSKNGPDTKRYIDVQFERAMEDYYDFILNQLRTIKRRRDITEEEERTLWSAVSGSRVSSHRSGSGFGFSSDVLDKISDILVDMGIAGVTYTGRHDRRCCLVYNLTNVFPVAYFRKEKNPRFFEEPEEDSEHGGTETGKWLPIDYSGNFREHRRSILNYDRDRLMAGDKNAVLAKRFEQLLENPKVPTESLLSMLFRVMLDRNKSSRELWSPSRLFLSEGPEKFAGTTTDDYERMYGRVFDGRLPWDQFFDGTGQGSKAFGNIFMHFRTEVFSKDIRTSIGCLNDITDQLRKMGMLAGAARSVAHRDGNFGQNGIGGQSYVVRATSEIADKALGDYDRMRRVFGERMAEIDTNVHTAGRVRLSKAFNERLASVADLIAGELRSARKEIRGKYGL